MRIILKLYGNLKKYAPERKERASIKLNSSTTIADLLSQLQVPNENVWMTVVNDQLVSESTRLHDGDVLEVFEPVGGGSKT